MKELETLSYAKITNGRFTISMANEVGEILIASTTNTLAIDCAFDDDYDLQDNSDRFYQSQLEAKIALIEEIRRNNY